MASKSRRIPNVNGATVGPLKSVPYVDTSEKFSNNAIKDASSKDKAVVLQQLLAIKQIVHDADEHNLKLDAKMSDIMLGRIASLLDEVKNEFAETELNDLKEEILDEIDGTSIANVIKNFLMSRIANLFDDDAKKDDIEDLKKWIISNIKTQEDDIKQEEENDSNKNTENRSLESKNANTKDKTTDNMSNAINAGQKLILKQFTIFNSNIKKLQSGPMNTVQQKAMSVGFSTITNKIKDFSINVTKKISSGISRFSTTMKVVGKVTGNWFMSLFGGLKLMSLKTLSAIAGIGVGVLLVGKLAKSIIGGIGKLFWNIGKLGFSIIAMPFKLLGKIASLLNPINLVMTIIKAKIFFVVATIGLIVLGLYMAWKHIGKIIPWIWKKLLQFGEWIWENLPGWLESLWEWTKDLWKWLWPKLVTFGKWLLKNIPIWLAKAWEWTKDLWKWLWPKLVTFGKWLLKNIPIWLAKAWEWTKDFGKWLWQKLLLFGGWIWKNLPGWLESLWEWTKDFSGWIWNKLKEFGEWLWKLLPGWLESLWEWTKDFGKWLWEKLLLFGGWIWKNLPGWLESLWEWTKDFGKWLWEKLLLFGGWIWEKLPGWLESLWEWTKDFGGWIWNKLVEFGKWLWDWIKSLFTDVIIESIISWYEQSWLKKAIDTVIRIVNKYVIAPLAALKRQINKFLLSLASMSISLPTGIRTEKYVGIPIPIGFKWTDFHPLGGIKDKLSHDDIVQAESDSNKSFSEILNEEMTKVEREIQRDQKKEEVSKKQAESLAVQQVQTVSAPVLNINQIKTEQSSSLEKTTEQITNNSQNQYTTVVESNGKLQDMLKGLGSNLMEYMKYLNSKLENPYNNTIIISNSELAGITNSAQMQKF